MAKPKPPKQEVPEHDADADRVLRVNQNLQSLKSEIDDKAKVNGRLLQQVILLADVVDSLQQKLKAK
ncbi:MAG: hypothetical protein JO025_22010 [Verrucomicrobia bacterium]|nr:hypothetical protein [Verrucomicrobiota bacterium]